MEILVYGLICLTSLILVGLVLMQDSKSGLGSIGGGATMNTFGGNTDKALIKATSVVAGIFFLLIIASLLINKGKSAPKSVMEAGSGVPISAPEESQQIKKDIDLKSIDLKNPTEGAGQTVTIPIDIDEETKTDEAKATAPEGSDKAESVEPEAGSSDKAEDKPAEEAPQE